MSHGWNTDETQMGRCLFNLPICVHLCFIRWLPRFHAAMALAVTNRFAGPCIEVESPVVLERLQHDARNEAAEARGVNSMVPCK